MRRRSLSGWEEVVSLKTSTLILSSQGCLFGCGAEDKRAYELRGCKYSSRYLHKKFRDNFASKRVIQIMGNSRNDIEKQILETLT
ncbi:hypothetical protein Tco_1402199 [Tanacetum coccineum]